MWQADLTTHGDVHPNPGPPNLPFSLWSCNVGRGTGAWEFFELALAHNIDVIAIQEDGLIPSERSSFYKRVSRNHYRVYAGSSMLRPQGAFGGVILLVHSSLRSCQLGDLSVEEGQCATALVENVAISTVYQPPSQGRLTIAEHLQEMLILLPRHMPWLCIGDHNDEPHNHPMLQHQVFAGLEACFAKDNTGNALSTRWEGTRCIDYFITNAAAHINDISLLDEAIADHKIVSSMILSQSHDRIHPYRLVKSPKLQRPDDYPLDLWQQACQEYVDSHSIVMLPQDASQLDTDLLWDNISAYYENMLTFALMRHGNPHPRQQRRRSLAKGQVSFTRHYPSQSTLDRANDGFVIRKLRNFIAKIREVMKLQRCQRTSTPEYASLIQKLQRSPFFQLGIPWAEQLEVAEEALHRERAEQSTSRLHAWKQRMQSSIGTCYKWIKTTQYTPFCGLFSASLHIHDVTTSITDALALIREHWRLVWQRPHHDLRPALDRINAEMNRLHFDDPPNTWTPLTANQLAQRATKLKGKAAGPDQWTGDELASISPEHLSLFANFCSLCEKVGCLPSQWTIAIQCHLPKAQKGIRAYDGARDVCGLRPLTLFSSWYRLWASARLKSVQAQDWIGQWCHPSAVGGKKGKEIYHALIPLITAASENEYLVSLDFSLAFDYCDPRIATHIFELTGMPVKLCQMLLTQWTSQKRIITFDGFCIPEYEQVSVSLPQGDPFSLIAMVAVMMPAMYQIALEFPTVTQRNFVDDRTWAAPLAHTAMEVEHLWSTWSQALNLRENTDKNQYFHATAVGRRVFVAQGAGQNKVSDQMCVLGHTFRGAKQRSLTSKEKERFESAKKPIRRTSFLPLPLRVKLAVIATGPLSKAEFGWCMYAPPLTACDTIDKAIRSALNEPKHSCVHLRNILRGHRLNLRFRVLTTCINALHRVCSTINFPTWHRIGLAGPINKFLTHMSWIRNETWCWTHSTTGASFSLDPSHANFIPDSNQLNHILREGFRAHEFHEWLATDRNDATACAGSQYSELRCKQCRSIEQSSAHRFAVHTGGFVSNAAFGVMTETPVTCNCGSPATLDHMLWHCAMVPNANQRPPIPHDPLQRRLGWPCGSPHDEAIVAWMVAIRKYSLSIRHKPPLG